MFKIVRVKNKLDMPTKDILINVLFRSCLVIEIQLAVKSEKTPFSSDLSRFHHFIYELQRADFGPISEMCSIWMNYDLRGEFYLEKIDKINVRENHYNLPCLTHHQNAINKYISLPFRCDSCHCYYSENNSILPSIVCSSCRNNICFVCRLDY